MSLERNTQALIDLVQRAAASRRAELIGVAQSQANALLREAREEARRKMRRAFDDERRRARERLAAAQAMLETRRRLALQRRNGALLATGWQVLPDALVDRWLQQAARAAWVACALTAARQALPKRGWRIVHPPAWPVAEREALVETVAHETGVAPALHTDPDLRAGIAIVADGTTVDATLAGLVADRAEIGASLLQRLDEQETAAHREALT
jgi:hypothetical protein